MRLVDRCVIRVAGCLLVGALTACGSDIPAAPITGTGDGALVGTWTGTMGATASGPVGNAFTVTLVLNHHGDEVTGTARVAMSGQPQYYAEYLLVGESQGENALIASMTDITSQRVPPGASSWCRISIDLAFSMTTSRMLTGTWAALSGCAPPVGNMELTSALID